jgi:hypothetical protein
MAGRGWFSEDRGVVNLTQESSHEYRCHQPAAPAHDRGHERAQAQPAHAEKPHQQLQAVRRVLEALAERCRRRDLRNGVTSRQKPDRLEMPQRRGVVTGHIPLFQLIHTQMLVDRRHVSIPRLMALQPICFAKPWESTFPVESIPRKPYYAISVSLQSLLVFTSRYSSSCSKGATETVKTN